MAGNTKTILYYTGNCKEPGFVRKIQDTLLQNCGGLPIVSVSQKPMQLGKNICVGEVGHSYLNVFRQMMIGARAIKTEFVVFAEDDFLYPPEYFSFEPVGDYYQYDNTWMVLWRGKYHRTLPVGGAQIARRDFLIRELEAYLDGHPEWADGKYEMGKPNWSDAHYGLFTGPPVVAFKPKNNLSRSGRSIGTSVSDLPMWGNVHKLRERYEFA